MGPGGMQKSCRKARPANKNNTLNMTCDSEPIKQNMSPPATREAKWSKQYDQVVFTRLADIKQNTYNNHFLLDRVWKALRGKRMAKLWFDFAWDVAPARKNTAATIKNSTGGVQPPIDEWTVCV